MTPNNNLWASPNLQRYRPAVLALTALAVGCTIYYIHETLSSTSQTPKKVSSLHRSNARRRHRSQVRPRSNTLSGDTPSSLTFLSNEEANEHIYGWHAFRLGNGELRTVPLTRRQALAAADAREDGGFSEEEASLLREELQTAFLDLYIYRHLRSRPVGPEQRRRIIDEIQRDGGFPRDSIALALSRNDVRRSRQVIDIWIQQQLRVSSRPIEEIVTDPLILEDIIAERQLPAQQETVADTESEDSWLGDDDDNENKEGQSLLNLLYRIAEEQARREGFVHRGITCNGCSAHPIKGIRYRCANCMDFDLCEPCEALQIHPKTHLFYKVRVPRSHLGHQPQQIKYPGKYPRHSRNLNRERVLKFSRDTGYKCSEVEGLWEQFRCLAATDWPADPGSYKLAIDRLTFEQMFLPTNWTRPPPPSLIYDRVFSFYDTNSDNLIGFEELINGLANLNKRGPKERWKRIFKGYDIDGDGYVCRKDFLRMFKAHYALTKEMTREMIAGMEEESNNEDVRDLITGGQPLSSAFTHSAPPSLEPRIGEGKIPNEFGDFVVNDQKGAVDEGVGDDLSIDEVIAQHAEAQELVRAETWADVHAMILDIYRDPWPPELVLMKDVISVLGERVDPPEIKDVGIQLAIRGTCHGRTALRWQRRQIVRHQALVDRRLRSVFYTSDSIPSRAMKESRLSESHSDLKTLGSAPTIGGIKRLQKSDHWAAFIMSLEDLIAKLNWPIVSLEEFKESIVEMAELEWTGHEMLKALKAYTLNVSDIEEFVRSVLSLFRAFIPPDPLEETKTDPAAPASRRSRSSSKVRFEDGLATDDDEHETRSVTSMSSRSIPNNERWGGFEVPEPEEDVGLEVLFQITQEAMNGLLDPIFKLREDLWLEAQTTKSVRKRQRSAISAAVDQPQKISRDLQIFLRQHRIKSHYPLDSRAHIPNGAKIFRKYVQELECLERTDLTCESCPKCKNIWILFGGDCESCRSPTSQMKMRNEEEKLNPDAGVCLMCMKHAKLTSLQPDQCCSICGSRSDSEDGAFWHIISGRDDWPSRRQELLGITNGVASSASEIANNDTKPLSTEIEGSAARDKFNASSKALDEKFIDTSSKAFKPTAGEITLTAKSSLESQNPNTDQDIDTPAQARSDETTASPVYPEMALDLHDAVRNFNEADLSIEERTAQKSLDDLLKESGYATVDRSKVDDHWTPDSSSSQATISVDPPPDPTLPQNRPDSADNVKFERSACPSPTLSSTGPGARTPPRQPEYNTATLKYWAALYILEAEDEERGGPGLLSEKEFMEIMLGERGKGLAFLGEWMDLTTF